MPRHPRPIRAWQLPETSPVPTGQAAALEAALDRELVRRLGAGSKRPRDNALQVPRRTEDFTISDLGPADLTAALRRLGG